MLLNPFCPLSGARVVALKAAVVVLLSLLIKSRLQIKAFSALGVTLLLLQTLLVLAVGGALAFGVGGATFYARQQRF
jgi:hypothetical protein